MDHRVTSKASVHHQIHTIAEHALQAPNLEILGVLLLKHFSRQFRQNSTSAGFHFMSQSLK